MTRRYFYEYDSAKVTLEVDSNILTDSVCKDILDFYGEPFDENTNLTTRVLEMCVLATLQAGVTFGNHVPLIKDFVKSHYELDLLGSKSGIKIIEFIPFNFENGLVLKKVQDI